MRTLFERMAEAARLPKTVIFFREDCFYPVTLLGAKPHREEVADHVALNPGTIRVEDDRGNVLWPEGSKQ